MDKINHEELRVDRTMPRCTGTELVTCTVALQMTGQSKTNVEKKKTIDARHTEIEREREK